MAGDTALSVLSVGRDTAPSTDQLTVQVPGNMKGVGETDLYIQVNGEISNVARLDFEPAR